jgi:hypothetical protein
MDNNIEEAREFLKKLEPDNEQEFVMKKIRAVLIRQFLEDTKSQLRDRIN